jgi:hypothetical protein
MTTSPTSTLSEPTGTDRVSRGTLAYFRARLKQRIHSLIVREFKESGLSQADLARRLGKEPAQLCRLLSGPGNLTLDTVSDLLFAISGAELSLSAAYPLRESAQDRAAAASRKPRHPMNRSERRRVTMKSDRRDNRYLMAICSDAITVEAGNDFRSLKAANLR